MDQLYVDTAHLLRRAGFGGSPDEISRAAQKGLVAATDDLLHPERTPDPADDGEIINRLASLVPETKNGSYPLIVLKMWWTHRMVTTPHPLVEKMTLFWHGHFTSKLGGLQGDEMLRQNQMFRANALGNFRTLTLAVSRDPAMLKYLNGNQNYKAHPNENYGRELMELFTCGIGNYTEDDVKAAARAFSGWNLQQGDFSFNPYKHDNDPKTFMGKTGNWNGDDIVDMLVAHPATARRLCTQLFSFFAYPNPEPAAVNALVKTYYDSGYDIRAVVGQILSSRAFYSDKARYALIKAPVQYVVGSVKMLGLEHAVDVQPAEITLSNDLAAAQGGVQAALPATRRQQALGRKLGVLAALPLAMRAQGQDIFEPPSVKGWDGGEMWINTSTLLTRINFANLLSQSRIAFDGQFARATDFVQQKGMTPAAWVNFLAAQLGPLPLSPATRQTLIDYINSPDAPPNNQMPVVQNTAFDPLAAPFQRRGQRRYNQDRGRRFAQEPGGLEGRLRGVIPLIMATPEYQVC